MSDEQTVDLLLAAEREKALREAADALYTEDISPYGSVMREAQRTILALIDTPAPTPEEYCAKCGSPKSNHPYRHPFVARETPIHAPQPDLSGTSEPQAAPQGVG